MIVLVILLVPQTNLQITPVSAFLLFGLYRKTGTLPLISGVNSRSRALASTLQNRADVIAVSIYDSYVSWDFRSDFE